MRKNRFFKDTIGVPCEAIVAQLFDISDSPSGAQESHQAFVENAPAGAIAAYWDDTNLEVATGGTALAANANRKFFYAWKDADGEARRSQPIPTRGLTYKQVSYNAGTADVFTVTYGGTIAVSQWIHVRIQDTTATILPYPHWAYSAKVTSTVAAAVTALAAAINAETHDDAFVTASGDGTTLTVTSGNSQRNIKVTAYIETSASEDTDASSITITHTTKATAPVGTLADVQEFEKYSNIGQGGINYTNTQAGTSAEEFGQLASNAVNNSTTSGQYGYLIVSAEKSEYTQGSTRSYPAKAYVIIAVRKNDVVLMAAL
jgi:hypothetical protein